MEHRTPTTLLLALLFLALPLGCGGPEPASAPPADGGTGGAGNGATGTGGTAGSGGTGTSGSGTGGSGATTDAAWDGGIIDVTADWQGTWTSSRGPSGMLSAHVTSSDPTITGTITLGGSTCFTRPLSFTGSSLDLHILLFATQSEGELRIAADVSPSLDTMTGTYEISLGACDGDRGTLALHR